jgi:benzoate/toluate 1,2-dioxygenase beta subunit
MSGDLSRAAAEEFLYREALLLDRGEWDAWLALYREDAVFWMPAWRNETVPTDDPESELSLIYYQGRRNLEERVWRARSGLSVASAPRPRVVHVVSNVLVERATAVEAELTASFAVYSYDARSERTHVFFGRYEYRLRPQDEGWQIAAKKIILLNDVIPTVVDFYSV